MIEYVEEVSFLWVQRGDSTTVQVEARIPEGKYDVAEIIEWLSHVPAGAKVTVEYNTWSSDETPLFGVDLRRPATAEELIKHAEEQARRAAQKEQYERAQYESLRQRYEPSRSSSGE